MGENTSIWWSRPLGFGDKVISYNSCIVQCCPLILGEGGGGQQAKPHLSWIGYYLEMEVINKADTKLFSLFYISKGKSMQINCIFSKMTKIHILTPCLWHPIWTTCWSLIFTKIDIKVSQMVVSEQNLIPKLYQIKILFLWGGGGKWVKPHFRG